MASRPTYTAEQLGRYFDHIGLPAEHRAISKDDAKTKDVGLKYLQSLQKYQMTSVPFENLSQHYSSLPTPVPASTDPQVLFNKIVGSGHKHSRAFAKYGGRGGVCFENNIFYGTVLRSLGFAVCSVGGRVRQPENYYSAWSHMVNIVTLEDSKFAIDVGFGRGSSVQPLELTEGIEYPYFAKSKVRLVRKSLPEHTDPTQRIWVNQYHSGKEDAEWEDKYCFTETEFLPIDYESMSVLISFRRSSIFFHSILLYRLVRMDEVPLALREENRDGDVIGEISGTKDRMVMRIGIQDDGLRLYDTEDARLTALREWFGITFSAAEKQGVKSTAVALKA